jgi:hypothetical protein
MAYRVVVVLGGIGGAFGGVVVGGLLTPAGAPRSHEFQTAAVAGFLAGAAVSGVGMNLVRRRGGP